MSEQGAVFWNHSQYGKMKDVWNRSMKKHRSRTYNFNTSICEKEWSYKTAEWNLREEKCGKKSAGRKTLQQYELMLSNMQPEIWYQSSDFTDLLNVKERRIQILWKELHEKVILQIMVWLREKDIKKFTTDCG